MVFLLKNADLLLLLSMVHAVVNSLLMMHIIVKTPAPPKVTNVKIIGEFRENSKITVTGIVTGGSEGSSRVQWFKKRSSVLDDDKDLEVLSTSKIAKVGDVYFSLSMTMQSSSTAGIVFLLLYLEGSLS